MYSIHSIKFIKWFLMFTCLYNAVSRCKYKTWAREIRFSSGSNLDFCLCVHPIYSRPPARACVFVVYSPNKIGEFMVGIGQGIMFSHAHELWYVMISRFVASESMAGTVSCSLFQSEQRDNVIGYVLLLRISMSCWISNCMLLFAPGNPVVDRAGADLKRKFDAADADDKSSANSGFD